MDKLVGINEARELDIEISDALRAGGLDNVAVADRLAKLFKARIYVTHTGLGLHCEPPYRVVARHEIRDRLAGKQGANEWLL